MFSTSPSTLYTGGGTISRSAPVLVHFIWRREQTTFSTSPSTLYMEEEHFKVSTSPSTLYMEEGTNQGQHQS